MLMVNIPLLRCPTAAFAVALAALASVASAPASGASTDASVFLQGGDGDRAVKSANIGITHGFDPFDCCANTPWSFYGEAMIGEWWNHERRENERRTFTVYALTPVVRYEVAAGIFVEAGIGLTAIAPRFNDAHGEFSTKFNFGDHLAIGTRFGARNENEVTFRAEHYSNGGIRNPNPGQNFLALRYSRHF